MEIQFRKTTLSCLDSLAGESRNAEQTQEIKLTDGMPDIGHVVAAWGQSVLRAKEWRGDSLVLSAGMLVWVLYAPEDGSPERCLNTWIPFQMKWELPSGTPEGKMRMLCHTRFVDARSVSPRKIMVRAGLGAMAEGWTPFDAAVYSPEGKVEGIELLEESYPVRLNREAGEKTVTLDERLPLPDGDPAIETILSFRLTPKITESSVLTEKLVFRGMAELHVLYRSQEGSICAKDLSMPFSQYVQLEGEYGSEAKADIALAITGAELDVDDEGSLRFKGGITAQYLIRERTMLRLISDAYAPGRELSLEQGELELPVILDTRKETVTADKNLAEEPGEILDLWPVTDFPRPGAGMEEQALEVCGSVQVLSREPGGSLRSTNVRWEEKLPLPRDRACRVTAIPQDTQAQLMNGIRLNVRSDVEVTASAWEALPMVTALTLGEKLPQDPQRPSLILRRAGRDRLWDIAKASGTTQDALRRINHLEKDPEPGQMLLIPVP